MVVIQNNLLDTIRRQPISIHGLIMIDASAESFLSCMTFCATIQSQITHQGRVYAIVGRENISIADTNSHFKKSVIEMTAWTSGADSVLLAQRLSQSKRKGEWALLLLGALESPWIESAGRLCDHVYLTIPDDTKQGFRKVHKSITKLQYAGVTIEGSYLSRPAA